MKEPRKLSLQEEIEREVQQIEKELSEHPELDDIQVTEEMDRALLAKIRAYEEEKEEEEAARRELAEKTKRSEGRNVEFSEELAPDLSALGAEGNPARDAGTENMGTPLSGIRTPDASTVSGNPAVHKIVPYRRKKKKYLLVSLVAVIVLVMGLGMTSVGSKSYLKVL